MKKVKFIVEKSKDGYSAWNEDLCNGLAATMGATIAELRSNAVESFNLLMEGTSKKLITEDSIQFVFNLGQCKAKFGVL